MIKKQPKNSNIKPKKLGKLAGVNVYVSDTQPKTKDKKIKYDWELLKEEFFFSNGMEVKAFFTSKFGRFDGNMSKCARGWPEEKKLYKQEAFKVALEKMKKEKSERVTTILDKIVMIVEGDIDGMVESGKGDSDALKKLWEIMRTEGGLPTRITHNVNDNANFDAGKIRKDLLAKLQSKK